MLLLHHGLHEMASVAGLAPARTSLKGWVLGLLCIHGQKVVALRGNAPRSTAYQAGALLLSYKAMADGVGIAPTQPRGSLGFRDRGITALPTIQKRPGATRHPLSIHVN